MGIEVDAVDGVLQVQTRIESKVDLILSLVRELKKANIVVNFEDDAEPASDAQSVLSIVARSYTNDQTSSATDTRFHDYDEIESPRADELSRAWSMASRRPTFKLSRKDATLTQQRTNSDIPRNAIRKSTTTRLDGWPHSVELLSRYCVDGDGDTPAIEIHSPFFRTRSSLKLVSNVGGKAWRHHVALPPHAFLLWAFFSALIITADSSATGLSLIFDLPQRVAVKIFFAACWTVDLLVNFCKGHRESGGEILPLEKSLLRYLKTWFTLDFGLLCLDWTLIIIMASNDSDVTNWSVINFARMYKFVVFVEDVIALRSDVRMVVFMRSMAFLVYSLWSLHVCSCFWLSIGIYSVSDTNRHWIDTAGDGFGDFLAAPTVYQYATSLHWVVSYANMGNIEMYCQNTVERMVCVFFMLGSFYVGSVAVSYLAALLFDFRLSSRDQTQQLQTLRRFLNENNVDNEVASSVLTQARERLSRLKARLAYTDVKVLTLLSSALVKELKYALVGRFLQKHALFRLWTLTNINLAKEVSMATDFELVAPGTTLFKPMVEGSDVFYLICGHMVFMQDTSTSLVSAPRSVTVDVAKWFCEAAMWTIWKHVGTMEAVDVCELSVIHAHEAARSLRQDEIIFRITSEYAIAFHHRIVTAGPPRTEWPDDLHVPLTNYADLVMQLPADVVLYIGMQAVHVFSNSSWWLGEVKKLEGEVKTGKCVLLVNAQGDVERIVSVLVFRLENASGQVLYQLGRLNAENVFEVEFRMPGKKRERGEQVSETIQRSPKLLKLSGGSEVIHEELQEKIEFSKEYGVRTNYLRAVQFAKLTDDDLTFAFQEERRLLRSGTQSTQRRPETHDALHELHACAVCGVKDDEARIVYAWLDEDKVKLLEGKHGEPLIKSWVSRFNVITGFLDAGFVHQCV